MNHRPLEGQVALVTGGGRRIGRAIALALGRSGASVIVNYNQSKAGALATAREIEQMGAQAVALRADISRPAQVQAMFRAIRKRFNRLDVLVNNAAVFFEGTLEKLTEKDWDRILGINLKGTFFCAQAAARIMQRRERSFSRAIGPSGSRRSAVRRSSGARAGLRTSPKRSSSSPLRVNSSPARYSWWMAGSLFSRQKAGGRRQEAEGSRQKAEGRRQ
ncbi:MAG: 3-ketoacyl-ACP reductase [Acidobacteria bacterium]|nr:MAG: 3-ketoacyl-ACP reductase [Acidobacteriota bacterium]